MKKIKPAISIIVPIYNSSVDLERCLHSIADQTLSDIEVILVNDCSPDEKDEDICLYFVNKDNRFKYLKQQQNTRQGGARNTGIQAATSKLVGFVDSDDWIDKDTYQSAINKLTKEDADIVTYGYRRVGVNNKRLSTDRFFRKSKTVTPEDNIYKLYNPSCWNKVFKRELFTKNNIWFPEKIKHEDLATMPRIAASAKKICYLPYSYYNYTQQEESTNFSIEYENIDNYFEVFTLLKNFLLERGLFDKQKIYHYQMIYRNIEIYSEYLATHNAHQHLIYLAKSLYQMHDITEYLEHFSKTEIKTLISPLRSRAPLKIKDLRLIHSINNLLP